MKESRYYPAVVLVVSSHAMLLAYSACCHSPVYNEVGHCASGMFTWQTGRFDLFRVNPPLIRTVATAPIVLVAPAPKWDLSAIGKAARYEYDAALQIARLYGDDLLQYVRIARLACIPFSLLGAVVCWRWSAELFGRASGFIALLLWCFSPSILGHASLMTSDAHAASMALVAMYSFKHWLGCRSWCGAIVTGGLLGLAVLSKSTLIVLLPICLVLTCVDLMRRDGDRIYCTWLRDCEMVLLSGVTCLLVVNAGFLARGTGCTLLELVPFQSVAFRELVENADGRKTDEVLSASLVSRIPIPLPRDFILGIDIQKRDFEFGKRCYLRECWQEGEGWWYFYVYAVLVKAPLGCLALLVVSICQCVFKKRLRLDRVDELVLLLPPLTILILVSSETRMSIHARYLIPAVPFVFIGMSRIGHVFSEKHSRAGKAFVVVLLTWTILSSLCSYPHSLSHFNESVGGARNAGKHLLDSNLGWDQDVLFLRAWIRKHPEALSMQCVTLGLTPPEISGVRCTIPPRGPPKPGCTLPKEQDEQLRLGPVPGWFAVDVNRVYGSSEVIPSLFGETSEGRSGGCDYSYFRFFEPYDMAGYSIYIYRITPEEANRVRRKLGLMELTKSSQRNVTNRAPPI